MELYAGRNDYAATLFQKLADQEPARGDAYYGMVRALLQLATADGLGGELAVEWPEGIAGSSANIRGALGGAVVRARTPAP